MDIEAGKCPKCGGLSGYVTDEAQVYERFGTWDGWDVDCEFVRTLWKHRKPRCADCGESVRIPKSHKTHII